MPKQRSEGSIDELRLEWRRRADAAEQEIMGKYHSRRAESGGFGHEGLGVYGIYQERLARKKVELGAKLLKRAGLEVTTRDIRKLTGQSLSTIEHYRPMPRQKPREQREQIGTQTERQSAEIIPFRRRPGGAEGRREP